LTYFLYLGCSAWLSAVRHADNGDVLPLSRLLLFEPITEEGRVLVRDLLSRYKDLGVSEEEPVRLAERLMEVGLKKKRGRQATPVYWESEIENVITIAQAEYKAFRRAFPRIPVEELKMYRGDLDEKRATIRMRSRCRGVGQDARVD